MLLLFFFIIFAQDSLKDLSVFKSIEEKKIVYYKHGFFYTPTLDILNTEETFYTKVNKIKEIFVAPNNINKVVSEYLFNMFLVAPFNDEIIRLDLNYLGVVDPIEAEPKVLLYLERLLSENNFMSYFMISNIDELTKNLEKNFLNFQINFEKNDLNKAYIQKFLFALKFYIENKKSYLNKNKPTKILPENLKFSLASFIDSELNKINKSDFEYVIYKIVNIDFSNFDTKFGSDNRTIFYKYRPTLEECYAISYYLSSKFLKQYLNLYKITRANAIVIIPNETNKYLKVKSSENLKDDIVPSSTCWKYHVASFFTIYYESSYYDFVIDSFFKNKVFTLNEWLDNFNENFTQFGLRFHPFQQTTGIDSMFSNLNRVKELNARPYEVNINCD